MKTIGIDCRFAATESGLGRYTRELVSHLLQRDDPIEYVLFVQSQDEEWLRSLQTTHPSTTLRASYLLRTTNFPHYSLSEQTKFPRILKQSHIDLLFSPHFNIPFFCPVPFIVTIHDLILHRYPNQATLLKQCGYRILMSRAVRHAKHIIAVSNFTAREICTLYGSKRRKKITVITEGVNEHFSPRSENEQNSVRQKYGLEKPFFLYVGNAKEHKNVQTLIDAFSEASLDATELVLVTGGKEAEQLKFGDRVRVLPEVSDEDLPALYSSAKAFVTASLYEGFGLPIAEAEACGCPVIASNRGAIPEVASDAAVLVEPTVEALANAMRSPPEKKFSPKRHFSWKESARQTATILLHGTY